MDEGVEGRGVKLDTIYEGRGISLGMRIDGKQR